MNRSQTGSSQLSVQQIADRIMVFRRITRSDQHLLMSALLSKDSLSPNEKKLVQQIYQDLKSGLIKVVD